MTSSQVSKLSRAAVSVLSPLMRLVRQELGRRGAGDPASSTPAAVGAELDEALRILLSESDTAAGFLIDRFKSVISDPPIIFDDPDARDWLRRDDVRELLKQATLDLVIDAPLDDRVEEARRLYGVSAGQDEWLGEPLFAYAVSFLALSLKSKVSLDTRLVLAADIQRSGRNENQLRRIESKINGIASTAANGAGGPFPGEAQWRPVEFQASRGLAAALLGQELGPGDVAACPRLIEADTLLAQLEVVGVARLAGVPGAGKSISMLQVASTMAARGWRIVRLDDPKVPPPALLAPNPPVLHLIDDAHLVYPAQLKRLEEAAGDQCWLLSAHTIVAGKTAGRGTVFLDAARAVRTIAGALEADYDRTFEQVRRLDDRIGASMMDERLDDRICAASDAEYPWQFCFILSGGWRRAKDLCASARAVVADLTLAALAIRQLATRDAHCHEQEARALLDGIEDDDRVTSALGWLLGERLLLAADDLRCPHQRFAAVMINEILLGRDQAGREQVGQIFKRALADDGLPLAGLATLLHELRYANAARIYQGWSHLVDPGWLEPALARCWKAQSPVEIRDASWFLNEIGAVYRNERALFAQEIAQIGNWIAACPPGACYALGTLANHIFNTDEALGETLRKSVDPAIFARGIDARDARRTSEVISLASSLRSHWPDDRRAVFMAALDHAETSKLMAEWPLKIPLSFVADICEFMVYTDEAFGLELIETLLGAITPEILARPIEAFHELDDIFSHALRLLDVLHIYKGNLAPSRKRKAVGRKYAAVFDKAPLAEAISKARKREYQTCAMLLSFLHDIAPDAYQAAVRAIDWVSVDATIGEDWLKGSRDAEVLFGVCFDDPEARAEVRKLVSANLHRIAWLPSRLALMFPDLAIEHLDADNTVSFDSRNAWAALIIGHVAAVRPDLLNRLIEPRLPEIAADLSRRSPTFLNEKLWTLAVIADAAPSSFERLVEKIDVVGAEVGWGDALKGVNNNRMRNSRADARQVTAFLIEKSIGRADSVGVLARKLRRQFPKASVPAPKTMKSPGPYRPIDHDCR